MELTKGNRVVLKLTWFSFLFFLIVFVIPVGAQTASQSRILAADLEKLEQDSKTPAKRSEALKAMARLYLLSGNREKAFDSWMSAAYTGSITDYTALLEASRLLVSFGEYERADIELRKIPSDSGETSLEARFLMAAIWAFGRGDTRYLVPLASDPLYIKWRHEIYYILWKTGDSDSVSDTWKARLLAEYPQSPEARISGRAENISAMAAPMWFLSSGIVFPALETAAEQIPQGSSLPSPQIRPEQARTFSIQTGLFGVEANAKGEAERLERAGFTAALVSRNVNGRELWAVMVDGGGDTNNTLRALKNSGWPDAFPNAQ